MLLGGIKGREVRSAFINRLVLGFEYLGFGSVVFVFARLSMSYEFMRDD